MNTGFQLPSPVQFSTLVKYGSAHVLMQSTDSHMEDMPVPVQTWLLGTGLDPWVTGSVWNCGWI